MFVVYFVTLLSIGYCLAGPITLEVGAIVKNDNGTVLQLSRVVKGIKVVEDLETGIVYLLSREKKNYAGAVEACRIRGMKLLKVDSPKKNEAVKFLIETFTPEGPFWMAAVWLGDKHWKWPNDKPIKHYYWDEGEPNNARGNEVCIELYHREALWDDQSCSDEIYYICELRTRRRVQTDHQDSTTAKSDLLPSRRVVGEKISQPNSI